MYRKLVERFREGSLRPTTTLDALPHIGPYLYDRLVSTYRPRGSRSSGDISVRQFVNAVKRMTTAQLKASLQRVLKNDRANLCVGKRGQEKYHVRDVNERGFRTMVALLRVLKANGDGHHLGRDLASNPLNIPYPPTRTDAAKHGPCKGKAACKASRGVTWQSRRCLYNDQSGFEGISPLPGQQILESSVAVIAKKEALARRVAGVSYVAKGAGVKQRVPGTRLGLA